MQANKRIPGISRNDDDVIFFLLVRTEYQITSLQVQCQQHISLSTSSTNEILPKIIVAQHDFEVDEKNDIRDRKQQLLSIFSAVIKTSFEDKSLSVGNPLERIRTDV